MSTAVLVGIVQTKFYADGSKSTDANYYKDGYHVGGETGLPAIDGAVALAREKAPLDHALAADIVESAPGTVGTVLVEGKDFQIHGEPELQPVAWYVENLGDEPLLVGTQGSLSVDIVTEKNRTGLFRALGGGKPEFTVEWAAPKVPEPVAGEIGPFGEVYGVNVTPAPGPEPVPHQFGTVQQAPTAGIPQEGKDFTVTPVGPGHVRVMNLSVQRPLIVTDSNRNDVRVEPGQVGNIEVGAEGLTVRFAAGPTVN